MPIHLPLVANGATVPGNPYFPARAFCDGGLIRRVIPEDGIAYINLHTTGAHQVCAAGLWVEIDAPCPVSAAKSIPSLWHGNTFGFRPLR